MFLLAAEALRVGFVGSGLEFETATAFSFRAFFLVVFVAAGFDSTFLTGAGVGFSSFSSAFLVFEALRFGCSTLTTAGFCFFGSGFFFSVVFDVLRCRLFDSTLVFLLLADAVRAFDDVTRTK